MSVDIVPLTSALLNDFYGVAPNITHRGYAAVEDGRVIGIAAVAFFPGNQSVLISDHKPEMLKHPFTAIKGARMMLRDFAHPGMCAVANTTEYPTAGKTLLTAGLRYAGSYGTKSIFIYDGEK